MTTIPTIGAVHAEPKLVDGLSLYAGTDRDKFKPKVLFLDLGMPIYVGIFVPAYYLNTGL